jgi:hypothetical protein
MEVVRRCTNHASIATGEYPRQFVRERRLPRRVRPVDSYTDWMRPLHSLDDLDEP